MGMFDPVSVETPQQVGRLFDPDINPVANDLRPNSDISYSKSPDAAANLLKLKQKTGLPSDLIERNLDTIERETARADFDPDAFAKDSPIVAQWMAEHPDHYAAAKDDYKNLGTIEGMVNSFKSNWDRVAPMEELSYLVIKNWEQGITPAERARMELLKHDQKTAATGREKGLNYVAAQAGYGIRQTLSTLQTTVRGGFYGGAAGAAMGAPIVGVGAAPGFVAGVTAGAATANFRYA